MNNPIFLQANASLKKGDLKLALQLYQELIDADPGNALAYENASIVHGDLGNNNEALNMSAKALELDPSLIIPHVTRAYILDRLGKKEESRIEIKKGLEKDSAAPEVLCCLGMFSLMDSKLVEAERYLKKAIDIRPSFYTAHYNLIKVYQSRNDSRKAFWQSLILFRLRPNIENLLRLTYIWSRTFRIINILILLISALLSLWVGPKLTIIVTFFLMSISFLGGIFIGFWAKSTQWIQFVISLTLTMAIGIIGFILYFIVNNISPR